MTVVDNVDASASSAIDKLIMTSDYCVVSLQHRRLWPPEFKACGLLLFGTNPLGVFDIDGEEHGFLLFGFTSRFEFTNRSGESMSYAVSSVQ